MVVRGDDPDEPPYNNGSSSSTIMPAELNFGLDGECKFVNINDSRYSV